MLAANVLVGMCRYGRPGSRSASFTPHFPLGTRGEVMQLAKVWMFSLAKKNHFLELPEFGAGQNVLLAVNMMRRSVDFYKEHMQIDVDNTYFCF